MCQKSTLGFINKIMKQMQLVVISSHLYTKRDVKKNLH